MSKKMIRIQAMVPIEFRTLFDRKRMERMESVSCAIKTAIVAYAAMHDKVLDELRREMESQPQENLQPSLNSEGKTVKENVK